jgi:hypothetical protein
MDEKAQKMLPAPSQDQIELGMIGCAAYRIDVSGYASYEVICIFGITAICKSDIP